jgi:5-methylcytosine-specific restriction endonuclease McrA
VPARDSPYRGAWLKVRRAVLARDGHRCHICGLPGAEVACNTRRRHEIEQAQRAGRQPKDLARSG